ncbi:MAG: ATP-binding protein [Gammaproteobacteria bacterium]|nr:ATP-binding protein [Gammaproteobacteria bacterium]
MLIVSLHKAAIDKGVDLRYEQLPTLITTNRPFAVWDEVFPNAASTAQPNL